jgi:membrane-associated phospholipid phosphatase
VRTPMRHPAGVALLATVALAGALTALPSHATADPGVSPKLATTGTVYYWNDVLLEVFRRAGGGPGPLARAAAVMHAGVFNAFNSADWSRRGWAGTGYAWYGGTPQRAGLFQNDDIAAGLVARDLLTDVFPAQGGFVAQAFTARHGTTTPPDAVELAGRVVSQMRALRTGDRSANTTRYQFSGESGAWQLTGSSCGASDGASGPVDPHWGLVRPFTMTSTTQFRQPPPGGAGGYQALLTSALYTAAFNEVKALGRFDSTTRTAEQTQIAWFWANDLNGTYKPPGQLLDHTRIVAQQRGIASGLDLARLFARVSLALADAGIAAWDMKYLTSIDLWRPQTAIQQAQNDNNPNTVTDFTWLPLSADRSGVRFTPCFPAWVSGHATFGAAWAGVMRRELGDNVTMTLTTEDPHAVGVRRTLSSFTQAAQENARSRIFLGVHYQFDAASGLAAGFALGDHVHRNFLGALTL